MSHLFVVASEAFQNKLLSADPEKGPVESSGQVDGAPELLGRGREGAQARRHNVKKERKN